MTAIALIILMLASASAITLPVKAQSTPAGVPLGHPKYLTQEDQYSRNHPKHNHPNDTIH